MSVMKSLQAEISRLARKEIKKELDPVKRVNATQRGLIANLRRDVSELQKEVSRLQRELTKEGVVEAPSEESERSGWITGKGVSSLRKKLGLTQAELAKLAGVSTQSVVKWEKTEGKIPFRQQKTLERMGEIRAMGKTDAAAALEAK